MKEKVSIIREEIFLNILIPLKKTEKGFKNYKNNIYFTQESTNLLKIDHLKNIYNDEYVITLDELPDWS